VHTEIHTKKNVPSGTPRVAVSDNTSADNLSATLKLLLEPLVVNVPRQPANENLSNLFLAIDLGFFSCRLCRRLLGLPLLGRCRILRCGHLLLKGWSDTVMEKNEQTPNLIRAVLIGRLVILLCGLLCRLGIAVIRVFLRRCRILLLLSRRCLFLGRLCCLFLWLVEPPFSRLNQLRILERKTNLFFVAVRRVVGRSCSLFSSGGGSRLGHLLFVLFV
jgi:hypothetical protein